MLELLNSYTCFKDEKPLKIMPLEHQGYCNTNYLLKTSKKKYVLRVFGSLHVNRKFEFKMLQKAYEKGIGAKPILLDEKNSLLIYEYLKGTHKLKLHSKDIKSIANVLRKFHKIKPNKKAFDIKKELKEISSKKLAKAFKVVDKNKKDYVLCHHDLNHKNFIFSNNIKLIDMEFAQKNDRYFDLASFIVEFDLNKKDEKLFLNYYFKHETKPNIKKLNAYKVIYTKLCTLWFDKNKN